MISHAVVGTISLTSALIIYDGWARLRFRDVVAIIVGIVLAIFIARAFGEALAKIAAKGGPLDRSELLGVVRAECPFLLLAAPPIVLLVVLKLAGVGLGDAIHVVIWLGAASLGFWAGLAGVRAGLRNWRLALAVAIGFLVGGLVLLLKVALQPGKAASNGVAAINPLQSRDDSVSALQSYKVGPPVAKVAGGQASVSNDVPPASPSSLAIARSRSLGNTASQLANLLVSEVVDGEARLLQLVTDIHGG